MNLEILVHARIFARDLEVLEREVGLYPDDASLWKAVEGQPTLGGNLALHLAGNLRHFIGAVLGEAAMSVTGTPNLSSGISRGKRSSPKSAPPRLKSPPR